METDRSESPCGHSESSVVGPEEPPSSRGSGARTDADKPGHVVRCAECKGSLRLYTAEHPRFCTLGNIAEWECDLCERQQSDAEAMYCCDRLDECDWCVCANCVDPPVQMARQNPNQNQHQRQCLDRTHATFTESSANRSQHAVNDNTTASSTTEQPRTQLPHLVGSHVDGRARPMSGNVEVVQQPPPPPPPTTTTTTPPPPPPQKQLQPPQQLQPQQQPQHAKQPHKHRSMGLLQEFQAAVVQVDRLDNGSGDKSGSTSPTTSVPIDSVGTAQIRPRAPYTYEERRSYRPGVSGLVDQMNEFRGQGRAAECKMIAERILSRESGNMVAKECLTWSELDMNESSCLHLEKALSDVGNHKVTCTNGAKAASQAASRQAAPGPPASNLQNASPTTKNALNAWLQSPTQQRHHLTKIAAIVHAAREAAAVLLQAHYRGFILRRRLSLPHALVLMDRIHSTAHLRHSALARSATRTCTSAPARVHAVSSLLGYLTDRWYFMAVLRRSWREPRGVAGVIVELSLAIDARCRSQGMGPYGGSAHRNRPRWRR